MNNHTSFVIMDPLDRLQPDTSELIGAIIGILCTAIVAALFGARTYNVKYRYLTYSRWLVMLLYIFSWGFSFSAMILASTNNGNHLSCLLSELSCDIFYAFTKGIIYLWLIEKVWVVSAVRKARMQTLSYKIHLGLMTPYIMVFVLMLLYHFAEIEESGACLIGLRPIASIPLMVFDFTFNLYMTICFVVPLIRVGKKVKGNNDWKNTRLHGVAHRTLIASVVCLVVSMMNILGLTLIGGSQRSVLCLTCCSVDVTINVVSIHWVTRTKTGKTGNQTINSSGNLDNTMNGTFDHDASEKYNNYPMEHGLSDDRFAALGPTEEHGSASSQNSSIHKGHR
ncbi:hypothetical protein BX666DRAFT_1929839 [Dichotomocladium elegans]|nr:hypothetical protein BX666DRAFT_1929839 [Dichotomocladium elegans]